MNIPAAKIVFNTEDRAVLSEKFDEILRTGHFVLGKHTEQFEKEFAAVCGASCAVAVSGGTSALEIIFRSLDITDGSVIVPVNTFFATPAAVLRAGARVIFADCDKNLQLDIESVKRVIKKDTKAVVVVHIGGIISSSICELQKFCRDRKIFLIEDAAHAHGSAFNGMPAGSFGKAAAFSFFPTKIITAGEGGMVVTDDGAVAERARVFRDQGKRKGAGNIHDELGYNWRMSEFHAAIGVQHLTHLHSFIQERKKIAGWYDAELTANGFTPLTISQGVSSNFYKYLFFPRSAYSRVNLKKRLKEEFKISLAGEVYELPCHKQPIFKRHAEVSWGDVPMAERLCRRHICLPIFQGLKKEESAHVVASLKKCL